MVKNSDRYIQLHNVPTLLFPFSVHYRPDIPPMSGWLSLLQPSCCLPSAMSAGMLSGIGGSGYFRTSRH